MRLTLANFARNVQIQLQMDALWSQFVLSDLEWHGSGAWLHHYRRRPLGLTVSDPKFKGALLQNR